MSLPSVLQEMADVLADRSGHRAEGVRLALEIARLKGGQRVHIPAKVAEGHWLVSCVGLDNAMALCQHFSGGRTTVTLELPLGPSGSYEAQRRARQHAYEEAMRSGLSANEGAAAVGVTRRSFLRQRRARKTEPDLFSQMRKG